MQPGSCYVTSTIRNNLVEARIHWPELPSGITQVTLRTAAEKQGIKFLPRQSMWDLYEEPKVMPPFKTWQDELLDELVIQQWSD